MQKDTNRHLASRCIPPEESKETDPSEGEEDLTEGAETGAVETPDLTSSSSSSKRVVFGGTFPIDRPMSLNFAAVGSVRKRQQPMSLTVKTPRTFSIDEPIREDQSAEVSELPIDLPIRLTYDYQHLHCRRLFLFRYLFGWTTTSILGLTSFDLFTFLFQSIIISRNDLR